MRFTLNIELGNEGMQTQADVLAAITRSINYPQNATMHVGESEAVRDGNGNTVGSWEVIEDAPSKTAAIREAWQQYPEASETGVEE